MTDTPAAGPDLGAVFDRLPTAHLVVDLDLVIVEANLAYLAAVGRTRASLVGRHVFDAFPPTASSLAEDGTNPAEISFTRALAGETFVVPVVQYDLVDPATGRESEHYWSTVTAPLTDEDGRVRFVLQRVEDLTAYVRERARADLVEAELFLRSREVEAARTAAELAARTVAAQADVALRLVRAQDLQDARALITDFCGTVLQATCLAVTLLEDQPPGAAGAEVTAHGCGVVVETPVVVDGQELGELALGWTRPRELSAVDHDVVQAVAAQYGQTVVRLRARDAERQSAAEAVALSEALQRSLLSEPARFEGLQLTARYRAAAQQARVGGDWYDAFRTADGTITLTVGDVSGHDGAAAALMGQVRSLLRGIAYAVPADAGHVLDILDDALFDLGVDALASAVLLTVHGEPGTDRRVRWSNAGHPPPVLVLPGGTAEVLEPTPELLLGCQTGTGRTVHERPLPEGAAVLLYTDGLVERRDTTIDEGIEWLRSTVAGLAGLDAEELAEHLLATVADDAEDDVVVLVARVLPARTHRLQETLDPAAGSVPRARRLVTTCCRAAGVDEATVEAAVLVTSEAVTNAVVHGSGPVHLVVDITSCGTGDVVRLEVSGSGPAGTDHRTVDLAATGGRGEQLIDAVADAWGVRTRPGGTTVWADLVSPPA